MKRIIKKTFEQHKAELKAKQDELKEAIDRLNDNRDFKTYQNALKGMQEALKTACIREGDIEALRGYQSQYSLLISLYNLGEQPVLPDEQTTDAE